MFEDMLICASRQESIDELKRKLFEEFKIKDLGEVKHFMGIRIKINRSKQTLTIDQSH